MGANQAPSRAASIGSTAASGSISSHISCGCPRHVLGEVGQCRISRETYDMVLGEPSFDPGVVG